MAFCVFLHHPLYGDCNFQVKVQRVHIDGVHRTKTDIIKQHVTNIFNASNFDEVLLSCALIVILYSNDSASVLSSSCTNIGCYSPKLYKIEADFV